MLVGLTIGAMSFVIGWTIFLAIDFFKIRKREKESKLEQDKDMFSISTFINKNKK